MSGRLDHYLMVLAATVADQSGDTSKKVGCVITDSAGRVITTGFNDIPKECGQSDDKRCRPHKYQWTEHAERRTLNHAARFGIAVDGGVAYVTYFPCAACALAMVDSGIVEVVAPAPQLDHPRWGEEWRKALEILSDARVRVTHHEVPDVS